MTLKHSTKPTTMTIQLKPLLYLIELVLAILPTTTFANHIFNSIGTISLGNGYHVDISTEKAADWGQTTFTLYKDGDSHFIAIQRHNTYITKISNLDLFKIDLNHNNKPEYLIAWGTGGNTNEDKEAKTKRISWPTKNKKLTNSGDCGFTEAVIILDNMKEIAAFKYSNSEDPLATSSLQVMGPDRAKAIIGGKTEVTLGVTPGFSPEMWKAYVDYFNPQCKKFEKNGEPILQLPLSIKRVPLNSLKWKDYLPYLLKMHTNAQQAYKDTIQKWGPDYRTRALGVFCFTPFFSIFPFDSVDPENKEPQYTVAMNDYAFYLYNFDLEFINRHKEENKPIEGSSSLIELRESVIPILQHVLKREPTRTVAWLNLADAQWEVPELHAESANTYRQYLDLLHRSAPHSKPPKRALQRAK